MPEIPRFSEFNDEKPMDGPKVALSSILNREIIVTDFRAGNSKFNDRSCLTIAFELDGEKHVTFTGSDVLRNQLSKHKDKLPFYATIVRRGRYFSLS